MPPKTRILIAKPGLDGHDVGAKIIVRALLEAGFDVIYTGLRKTPEEIAVAASQEDVDVIGLSVLSGSHVPICEEFSTLRRTHGIERALWIVGGNIPASDHPTLERIGVDAIFAVGANPDSIVDFIRGRTA